MTASTSDDPSTTRRGIALLFALVVVASFMLPGGGLLAAFASRMFGVAPGRRGMRVLVVVAVVVLVLQVAFLLVAFWAPTEVCSSFNGGPTTCTTG